MKIIYYDALQINPDWRYMDQFNVLSLQSRAFVYDANGKKTRAMNSKEKNENEIDNLFDNIAYDKGSYLSIEKYILYQLIIT